MRLVLRTELPADMVNLMKMVIRSLMESEEYNYHEALDIHHYHIHRGTYVGLPFNEIPLDVLLEVPEAPKFGYYRGAIGCTETDIIRFGWKTSCGDYVNIVTCNTGKGTIRNPIHDVFISYTGRRGYLVSGLLDEEGSSGALKRLGLSARLNSIRTELIVYNLDQGIGTYVPFKVEHFESSVMDIPWYHTLLTYWLDKPLDERLNYIAANQSKINVDTIQAYIKNETNDEQFTLSSLINSVNWLDEDLRVPQELNFLKNLLRAAFNNELWGL